MLRKRSILAAAFAIAATLSPQALMGAPSARSVQVAARIASFLMPVPVDPVPSVILFRPGDPASVAEAALIERTLAGSPTLRVRRVAVNAAGNLAGVRVVFVTGGLAGSYDLIGRLTRAGALTIGSDRACATAGRCVVAVTTEPKVEIIVSRAARQASGLRFKSTFLMLVKEV